MGLLRDSSSLRTATTILCALLFAAGMFYYHLELLTPRVERARSNVGLGNGYSWGGDFYPIWLTSRELIANRHDPYSAEATQKIQIGLYGRSLNSSNPRDPRADYRTFAYPIFTDFIFAPLALVPFSVARLVMSVLLPLLAILTVSIWIRVLPVLLSRLQITVIIILTLASYPLLEAFFAEQVGILSAMFLAVAVAAVINARYKTAGLLLALATIKPQLALLLIVWFFIWSSSDWRRRKPLVLTFLASEVLLCAIGELLSPGWWLQWLHVIRNYPQYTAGAIPSEIFGATAGGAISFVILLGFAGVCWRLRHLPAVSDNFALMISSSLCVTVLCVQSAAAVYDQFLLLPIIIVLWSWRKSLRSQNSVSKFLFNLDVGLLLWPWIAASFVAVYGLLLTGDGMKISEFVLRLPQLTILPLPLGLLGLLAIKFKKNLSLVGTEVNGGDGALEIKTKPFILRDGRGF